MFRSESSPMAGRVSVMVVMLLSAISTGCGEDRGMAKVIVQGDVSYAGKPIVNGDIKFYPIPGTPGPVSGASIKEGHYVVTNKDGVPVGEHTVQIRAFANTGAVDDDLITAARPAARKSSRGQYIPEKYNVRTELTVQVSKENKTINFELSE